MGRGEVDFINVYRSNGANDAKLMEALREKVDEGKATLITGDLNLCLRKNPRNFVTKRLCSMGFNQLMTEATHIQGGWIDHVYWIDPNKLWKNPRVERFCVYYSDHDILLISLNKS